MSLRDIEIQTKTFVALRSLNALMIEVRAIMDSVRLVLLSAYEEIDIDTLLVHGKPGLGTATDPQNLNDVSSTSFADFETDTYVQIDFIQSRMMSKVRLWGHPANGSASDLKFQFHNALGWHDWIIDINQHGDVWSSWYTGMTVRSSGIKLICVTKNLMTAFKDIEVEP